MFFKVRFKCRISSSLYLDFCKSFPDFFRFWCSTLKLAHAFGARFVQFISGVFAHFNFLSCQNIVPLPKILASRLVTSLHCIWHMKNAMFTIHENRLSASASFSRTTGDYRQDYIDYQLSAPGFSYAQFQKAYEIPQEKGFFPYEWNPSTS